MQNEAIKSSTIDNDFHLSETKLKKAKPDATPIREKTKKILKIRAAAHGLSLVDYLEVILNEYFDQTDKEKINESELLERFDGET